MKVVEGPMQETAEAHSSGTDERPVSLAEHVSKHDLDEVDKELLVWETLDRLKASLGDVITSVHELEEYVDKVVKIQNQNTRDLEQLLSEITGILQQQSTPVHGKEKKMSQDKLIENEGMSFRTKMIVAATAGFLTGVATGAGIQSVRLGRKVEEMSTELEALRQQLPAGR